MDEDKLKSIVEEAIKPVLDQLNDPETGLAAINDRLTGVEAQLNDSETGLTALNNKLNDADAGLAAINSRLDVNTAAIVELESTIKGYADSYKANDTNIRKAEKRLKILEEDTGVNVPPELQFSPQSDL